jgi:hypothetical protein
MQSQLQSCTARGINSITHAWLQHTRQVLLLLLPDQHLLPGLIRSSAADSCQPYAVASPGSVHATKQPKNITTLHTHLRHTNAAVCSRHTTEAHTTQTQFNTQHITPCSRTQPPSTSIDHHSIGPWTSRFSSNAAAAAVSRSCHADVYAAADPAGAPPEAAAAAITTA